MSDERTMGERVDDACMRLFRQDDVCALLREQQTEIERLTKERADSPARRELTRMQAQLDALQTEHIAVMDERNQLRRDLEAARVDAERYRWLRDKASYHQRRTTLNDTGEGIDTRIDAARARGEGNADE
jgi:seryl-tRNA synthetase